MPCTTLLVGKKASFDGSNIICRTDDGSFHSKGTIVVERNKAPKKYVTVETKCEVELPDYSYRYTSHPNHDPKKGGIWPASGINEFNVAMTATETITSNPLVESGDPLVNKKVIKGKTIPGGIGEADFVALVLPYIKSAKEGVIRLGSLIEKYGTDERNGMAFSDENEIWWMESIGGHHWIARRVEDENIVIMPNQFGLDRFDFDDAYNKQEYNMCSLDLKEFININHLNLNTSNTFNPRLCFGSHTDQDHIYNNPRGWYLYRYFGKKQCDFDSPNALYNPNSDDIPWTFKPDHLVTIQEIKYILGSYYQDTKYNPYGKEAEHGKYRSIGVPNSDVTGIEVIRTDVPDAIKGIEWTSLGGGAFTCCFPVYTNVSKMPEYISKYNDTVSTNTMYWTSRLIAALTDAQFSKNVIYTERYQYSVFTKAYGLLKEYDKKYIETGDLKVLEDGNEAILKMVKEESEKVLSNVLLTASNNMKTRYNRGDN